MDNQQSLAWTEVYDHVKALFMTQYGAQAWYVFADGRHCGVDVIKDAVTKLANKDDV